MSQTDREQQNSAGPPKPRLATARLISVVTPAALSVALLCVALALPWLSHFGQVVVGPFSGFQITQGAWAGAVLSGLVTLICLGISMDRNGAPTAAKAGGITMSILAGLALIPAIALTLWMVAWSSVRENVAVGSAPGCPSIVAEVMSWDETNITFLVGHGILYTPVKSDRLEWNRNDGEPFAAGTYTVTNDHGNPRITIDGAGSNDHTFLLTRYQDTAPLCTVK